MLDEMLSIEENTAMNVCDLFRVKKKEHEESSVRVQECCVSTMFNIIPD